MQDTEDVGEVKVYQVSQKTSPLSQKEFTLFVFDFFSNTHHHIMT